MNRLISLRAIRRPSTFPDTPAAVPIEQEDLVHHPLERVNKAVERRTLVVDAFSNADGSNRRGGCILIKILDEWQIAQRRHLSESSIALIDTRQEVATPEAVAS